MDVGATVRAKLTEKVSRRAVVETADGDAVWDDDAPKPLRPFLVVPMMQHDAPVSAREFILTDHSTLFPFESTLPAENASIDTWKNFGDKLLQTKDPSAAASYYEMALSISSILQVGSTAFVKREGRIVAVEVDCINDGDMDVCLVETGAEATIPSSQAILCVLRDDTSSLQERILLNLTRCLLQLAETTFIAKRRTGYLKSAALASTLVLSIAKVRTENREQNSLTSTETNALLLRSQAQKNLKKFAHARADLNHILSFNQNHRESVKGLHDLEQQKKRQKKQDKNLAKNVSEWVGSVMHDNSNSVSQANVSTTQSLQESCPDKFRTFHFPSRSGYWLSICAAILISFLLLKYTSHTIEYIPS